LLVRFLLTPKLNSQLKSKYNFDYNTIIKNIPINNLTKTSNKNNNILMKDTTLSYNFILGLINYSNINTISENKITQIYQVTNNNKH